MAPLAKRVLIVVGVLAGLVLLTLVAWVAVAGPVTVGRILRYGDTDIDDWSHYPGRQLVPSGAPFHFAITGAAWRPPPAVLADYGHDGDLDAILAANDTIAFLVVRGDTLLFERYFQGHTAASLSQAFSVSKSVTSILIGAAIDDGILTGVDQPITDLLPELAGKGFTDVTLRHLLTMMSGSDYHENDNPFGEHVILNYTPELEARILRIGVERPPGEHFRYKSGDNALLGLALSRALGDETITAYTQRRLWTRLGMEHPGVWSLDREDDGLEKTWCCLAASARDFAKLGRLVVRAGSWDGEQLLFPTWVSESISAQVPEAAWDVDYAAIGWSNYGYQWWIASPEDGDAFALGKNGQYLYINPRREVVIVRLGWSSGELPGSRWVTLFQILAREAAE
jgi:CubicO group peptidase (beta-lactamase class C family)